MLNTVRVVEQDNGAKVHFSLINYPLLFLEAIHKHTHMHTCTDTQKEARVWFLEEKGGNEGERKRVISAGYLSSLPLCIPILFGNNKCIKEPQHKYICLAQIDSAMLEFNTLM